MIKKQFAILIVTLCLAVCACTQQRQACVEPILVSLRFSVLSTHTITDSAVFPPKSTRVSFDTVLPKAFLIPLDPAVKNETFTFYFGYTSQFSLLLDPNKDTCRWYLSQDSLGTPIDTISFFYTRKLQFLSNACGYTYYYNLTGIPTTPNLKNNLVQNALDTLHHRIDSIIIENAGVTNNVNLEHLKIFIHNPH
jgi:hypothetical protein